MNIENGQQHMLNSQELYEKYSRVAKGLVTKSSGDSKSMDMFCSEIIGSGFVEDASSVKKRNEQK